MVAPRIDRRPAICGGRRAYEPCEHSGRVERLFRGAAVTPAVCVADGLRRRRTLPDDGARATVAAGGDGHRYRPGHGDGDGSTRLPRRVLAAVEIRPGIQPHREV